MFAAHGAGMVPPMLPLPPAGMYGAIIHRPDDISDSDEESCDEGSGEIDVHKELAALTPKKWKTLRNSPIAPRLLTNQRTPISINTSNSLAHIQSL